MARHTKVCDYCGEQFEAQRSDARFCSSAHKAAYHREGGPRPQSSVTVRNRPPHEQAEIDGFSAFKGNDDHDYITIPVSLYNFFMRQSEQESQKKSDFAPSQTTFTPPTEKPVVREVSDEERIKRTAANTAAALEDF